MKTPLTTEPKGASPRFTQLPAGQLPQEVSPTAFPLANENAAKNHALREPGLAPCGSGRTRYVNGSFLSIDQRNSPEVDQLDDAV